MVPRPLILVATEKTSDDPLESEILHDPAVDELKERLAAEWPFDAVFEADPVAAYPILEEAMTSKWLSVLLGLPLEKGAYLYLATGESRGVDPDTGEWKVQDPGARYRVSTPGSPWPGTKFYLTLTYD